MHDQLLVFLTMALAFGIGWFFIDSKGKLRTPWRTPPLTPPLTRRERESGLTIRFIASSLYTHYRNAMRDLRRFCGWPSGRQWVKSRKHWNREYPQGARRFAHVVSQLKVNHHTKKKEESL